MTDGYLSRDKGRIAELQRKRRARMTRIDYMPGREALRAIDSLREKDRNSPHHSCGGWVGPPTASRTALATCSAC